MTDADSGSLGAVAAVTQCTKGTHSSTQYEMDSNQKASIEGVLTGADVLSLSLNWTCSAAANQEHQTGNCHENREFSR